MLTKTLASSTLSFYRHVYPRSTTQPLTIYLQKQFNLKSYSATTFLNAFTQLTKVLSVDAEIPQEMFDLWLRLADKYVFFSHSSFPLLHYLSSLVPPAPFMFLFILVMSTYHYGRPANLTVIVNFLLRKGITDRDLMPICKTVCLLII